MLEDIAANKSLLRRLVDWIIAPKTLDDSGFKVLDNNRFAIWWTNNYEDNEGEIFPAVELDTFIGKVERGEYPYPTLQFAHLSGTDHGKTDHLWRVGNFALATGTFDDTPTAERWKMYHAALRANGAKIGISHRYWFSEQQMDGKAYGPFQTFEISWFPVVPGVKPANPLTSMEIKTMAVKIPDTLRESMKKDGGFTDAEIDALETTAKQLDERAIAERRAAKTEGGETTPVTPEPEKKPEPETPVEPAPEVKPVVDEAAVQKAVDEAEAKWQQAFKLYQDDTAKKLDALTQAVTTLTAKVNDGFALKKPASKSIWTIAQEGDEDVADMEAAKAEAKKGKKRSVVEMMAGENHSDEM